MLVLGLGACSNDGDAWKLTDNIGSIPIELRDSVTFSYFLPGTGTFEFKQNFQRSPEITDVTTQLRIKDGESDSESVAFEFMLFTNDDFSSENLDFNESAEATKNSIEYITINSEGRVLIEDTNFYISRFSSEGHSGNYSGLATISVEQPADENGQPQPDMVEELFNVFGNINDKRQLFLLSNESDALFSNLLGTFDEGQDLFFGNAKKDDDVYSIEAQEQNAITVVDSTNTISYKLILTKDNQSKNLEISITKNTDQ